MRVVRKLEVLKNTKKNTGSGTRLDEVGCLEVRDTIQSFGSLCYDRSVHILFQASSPRVRRSGGSSLNY